MTLGERLKRARQAQEMSLSTLARASGLSKGFLSQVESGATNPSLGSLQRLAQALSLSASQLVSTDAVDAATTSTTTDRPRLVRRVHPEGDRSSLRQTGSSSQGAIYICHLLPGSALEGVTPSSTDAYLMVLSGEVEFSQGGTSFSLGEGDSLTYSLAENYRLAGHKRFRSSILLLLGSERELPRVVATALPQSMNRSPEVSRGNTDDRGPLRLVAMRAARTAERGRQP